jgi:hypothetical protein
VDKFCQYELLTAMDFRTAVTILSRQITTADIAEAMGVSPYTIRQARLQDGAPGYRTAPKGWESAFVRLAEQRQAELQTMIEGIRR